MGQGSNEGRVYSSTEQNQYRSRAQLALRLLMAWLALLLAVSAALWLFARAGGFLRVGLCTVMRCMTQLWLTEQSKSCLTGMRLKLRELCG